MLAERLATIIAVGLAVSGCYTPKLGNCTVQCTEIGDCADGQTCGADGFCATPSIAGTCANANEASLPVDAATQMPTRDAMEPDAIDIATDAARPDAPSSSCAANCPGTCQEAICVIDCTATGSCQGDVSCPVGLRCRIACGDGACQRVRCDLASSCDVTCSGKNSCAERVTCGDGRCDVTCSGDHSCRKGVDCEDTCACRVTCSGDMTCHDEARCPFESCETDGGCTDHGSCDRC